MNCILLAVVSCLLGDPSISVDGKSPETCGVKVSFSSDGRVLVTAANPISTVRMEWKKTWPDGARFLNDAWERSAGDICWRPIPACKAEFSPWYLLVTDGERTDGYGVMVQPNALCCWKIDSECLALEIDVTAGGRPVRLNGRTLEACTIVTRRGQEGESAFSAGRAFCRMMCPVSRLPKLPVYGYNDWYCAWEEHGDELPCRCGICLFAGRRAGKPPLRCDGRRLAAKFAASSPCIQR